MATAPRRSTKATKAGAPAPPPVTPHEPTTRVPPPPAPRSTPLLFAGPPSRLRATVTVENTSDQRVALRAAALHREGQPSLAATMAVLVPPGGTARVPVSFSIDATTAPGEYAAELEVGTQRRPVALRVEPHASMRVSPPRLLAATGRTEVELVVSNDGNVDVSLAPLVRARTNDGGPHPGPDVSLLLEASVELPAGTTVSITAHLEVPVELEPARRHTARIPVGVADLDIVILPRTASESSP